MKKTLLAVAVAALGTLTLSGCLRYPATNTSAGIDAARISFVPFDGMNKARVLVDGIDNGYAGDYKANDKALVVLPGTHIITVVYPDGHKVERKVYVDDAVTSNLSGF